MADKGTLTPGVRGCRYRGKNPGPSYFSNTRNRWATDQTGTLSGTVKESGVAQIGVIVRLYWRPNGLLVGSTFTDQYGAWSFSGLIKGTDGDTNYVVIALDPPTGTQYNDAIKALLSPG